MSSSDMDVVVYAPASIGNVSVGFDVLGPLCLQWMAHCWVTELWLKQVMNHSHLKQQAALFLSCQLKQKKTSFTTAGWCSLESLIKRRYAKAFGNDARKEHAYRFRFGF